MVGQNIDLEQVVLPTQVRQQARAFASGVVALGVFADPKDVDAINAKYPQFKDDGQTREPEQTLALTGTNISDVMQGTDRAANTTQQLLNAEATARNLDALPEVPGNVRNAAHRNVETAKEKWGREKAEMDAAVKKMEEELAGLFGMNGPEVGAPVRPATPAIATTTSTPEISVPAGWQAFQDGLTEMQGAASTRVHVTPGHEGTPGEEAENHLDHTGNPTLPLSVMNNPAVQKARAGVVAARGAQTLAKR